MPVCSIPKPCCISERSARISLCIVRAELSNLALLLELRLAERVECLRVGAQQRLHVRHVAVGPACEHAGGSGVGARDLDAVLQSQDLVLEVAHPGLEVTVRGIGHVAIVSGRRRPRARFATTAAGPEPSGRAPVTMRARWRHVRPIRLDQGPRRPRRRVPRRRRHRRRGAGGLQRRADQADRHRGRAAPARRGGHPRPGPHRAHAADGALGPGAVLGEGPEGWRPDDQRAVGVGRREAGVPPGVQRPPLPDPGRRLVRVAARHRSTSSPTTRTTPTAARWRWPGCGSTGSPRTTRTNEYPDGLVTATVLTTEAVGPLAQVHDRMPLVLPPEAWDAWLDPDRHADDDAVALARRRRRRSWSRSWSCARSSPLVNSVRNNGPQLLEPLPAGGGAGAAAARPAGRARTRVTVAAGPTEPVQVAHTARPGPRSLAATPTAPHAASLLLGHGAGGGVGAPDLVAAAGAALAARRARGARRAALPGGRPARTGARRAARRGLAGGRGARPRLELGRSSVGGRSSGRAGGLPDGHRGRRRRRAVPGVPGAPTGQAGEGPAGRAGSPGVPVLVVQGQNDPFGRPEPAPGREVVLLRGDHSLKSDAPACGPR